MWCLTNNLPIYELKVICATIKLLVVFYGMLYKILNKFSNMGCIDVVFLWTCWPMAGLVDWWMFAINNEWGEPTTNYNRLSLRNNWLIQVQDFRKMTHHFRGIYGIYLELIK